MSDFELMPEFPYVIYLFCAVYGGGVGARCTWYNIMWKFVSDLLQVSGFLRHDYNWNIVECGLAWSKTH